MHPFFLVSIGLAIGYGFGAWVTYAVLRKRWEK